MKKLTFEYDVRNCPPAEEVLKFRQGKLPKKLDEEITHHLTFCKVCSAKLAILQQRPDEAIPEPIELPAGLVEKVLQVAKRDITPQGPGVIQTKSRGQTKDLYSSYSVSEGDPDKVADQISDALLDAYLREDTESRVFCDTLVARDLCLVDADVLSATQIDVEQVVRKTIEEIGYTEPGTGFDHKTCRVDARIRPRSAEMVSEGGQKGVFDEGGFGGLIFGYACDETPDLMPLPFSLAQKLLCRLAELRKNGSLSYLRPDSKSHVVVEYLNDKPVRARSVALSTQHDKRASLEKLKREVIENVVKTVVPASLLDDQTEILINPHGSFIHGGPALHAGSTGRKSTVDCYGEWIRHGVGPFSGRDPSNLARSVAYVARYLAKNIVAAGLAGRCEVQLAYVYGVAEPVSANVDTFGTGRVSDARLIEIIRTYFPLTVAGVLQTLNLKRPIYQQTSAYGHFGRPYEPSGAFSWERTDASELFAKLGQ